MSGILSGTLRSVIVAEWQLSGKPRSDLRVLKNELLAEIKETCSLISQYMIWWFLQDLKNLNCRCKYYAESEVKNMKDT